MKTTVLLAFVLICLGFSTAINPQSKKITKTFFQDFDIEINTPAFKKDKGFTTYDELVAFLNNAKTMHPNTVAISYVGKSQKGKQIPLVVLNKNGGEKELKVWIQGGLHGDEPASTEGVLYLIDQLLNNAEYSYLLDKLEIGIIPMANIDGYEKQDRYAANGLDLNRDQTKLMVQESVFLKQAFTNFGAQVAVDFHEYRPYRKDFAQLSDFGVTSRFDVMFLYSGNLNVPKNLRELTQNTFVKNATLSMDENGLVHHDYVTTTKILGDIHFNQGSNNARSSATNYALTNAISSLIEVRGVGLDRTSFNRRVYTTFLVAASYLKTSFNTSEQVKQAIATADKMQEDVTVTSKKHISKQPLKIIDLATCKEMELEVTIRDALNSSAVLQRKRPTAYLIHKDQTEIIKKLKVLGVEVFELTSPKTIEVQTYRITDYLQQAEKYEGVNLQEVSTEIVTEQIAFEAGTHIVYLNQHRGNMAVEVLEPEAPNSFISFDVIAAELDQKLPIYRYLKQDKL